MSLNNPIIHLIVSILRHFLQIQILNMKHEKGAKGNSHLNAVACIGLQKIPNKQTK